MRVGIGYDIHPLVAGRPLVLAGVTIPYEKGLLGHSDADVLTHSTADAVLGAVGRQDIGIHFPDSEPRYENAPSIQLLKEVYHIIKSDGFAVVNIDATVIAQAPPLADYFTQMKANLASALCLPLSNVNVKATSPEGLGVLGSGAGIASIAVATLRGIEPS